MSCPTTETLECLALGFLEDEAPARKHLAACAECARRMEVLGKEHAALVAAAKAVPLPTIQPPAAKPPRHRQALPGRPRTALWKPLAAVAACVLVVVALAVGSWSGTLASKRPGNARAAPLANTPVRPALEAPAVSGRGATEERLAEIEREGLLARPVSGEEERWRVEELKRLEGELSRVESRMRAAMVREPAAQEAYLIHRKSMDASGAKRPIPAPAKAEGKPPLQEGPDLMTFKDHGINPTIDTSKETQSTFGLDVDTASYTKIRDFILGGRLPPKEAVRVEECLNYFRYQDPKPPKGAFAVRLEAAPSPFDAERHLLRIAIQAREMKKAERKDVILTFVIDVSGSMRMENRLELVKKSLDFLVQQLRPSDQIGIVVYGSNGRKLLDPTPVAGKGMILGIIHDLHTEGSTNLEAGLNIGYDLAAKHFDPKATNRVIICTDGVANNGVTDPDLLVKSVKDRADKGIWLSVLGFGMGNYNDHLMETLSKRGNGNYAYIDDFAEAKKIFTEKLVGMLEVVAADAKVQVEFDPATVANWRLVGYENRHLANRDFRNDKVDAGELGAGHHVTALYEITLKPGGEGRLATVRLRYREPETNEVPESQESLGRAQVLESVRAASPSYRLAAAVAQFAEILRESPRAKGITLAKVLEQARPAVADLDRPADALEFLDLVQRAAELKK